MSLLEQALKRPLTHHTADGAHTQWETDKRLGILDWTPTLVDANEYCLRRKEMGDVAYGGRPSRADGVRFKATTLDKVSEKDLICCDTDSNAECSTFAVGLMEGVLSEDDYEWFTKEDYPYAGGSHPCILREPKL